MAASLALDTSMIAGAYCLRLSVIYRGRAVAVPLVWHVLERESTSVAYGSWFYKDLLDQAARLLPLPLPLHCEVVLLADRGFANTRYPLDASP